MNPVVLLLGGAALLMLGGKKKKSARENGDDNGGPSTTPKPSGTMGFSIQAGTQAPPPRRQQQQQQGSQQQEELSWLERSAGLLCDQSKDIREEQAKIYAAIAVKGMRKAADSKRRSRRDKFPCNDPERLSWVVDEAFKLWVAGDPDATTTSKYWVEAGSPVQKRRPWNTMNAQESERSLTAIGNPHGMRIVQDKSLSPCARYIRDLLTESAVKKCPGYGGNPFPWG